MPRLPVLRTLPVLLALGLGCQTEVTPTELDFTTELLARSQFPDLRDSTATYEYSFSAVNPDSVVRALSGSRLPLREAWYPLDNLCMDPRGPRLTVRLARPDPRIARFDFAPGTGRLACATQLKHYMFAPQRHGA